MRLKNVVVLVVMLISSMGALEAQILGNLLKPTFDEITVNKRSVFAGEVLLREGLSLNGDAQFNQDVKTLGAFNAAADVIFSGIKENYNVLEHSILVIDESGELSRVMPIEMMRQLINENHLSFTQKVSFQDIEVLNGIVLGGGIVLTDGSYFTGEGVFEDGVNVKEHLRVYGTVSVPGVQFDRTEDVPVIIGTNDAGDLIKVGEAQLKEIIDPLVFEGEAVFDSAVNVVGNVDIEGTLQVAGLTISETVEGVTLLGANTLGEVTKIGENQLKEILDPIARPGLGCLTSVVEPGGEETRVPMWTHGENKIVVDECSEKIARVGIGTQSPEEKLHVAGTARARKFKVDTDASVMKTLSIGKAYSGNTDNTYQLEVAGNVKIDWNNIDFSEKIDLSGGSESASIYLGDDEHVLRVHRSGVNPGMYLTTYQNAGIYLGEGGGLAVGGSYLDRTVNFTPEASLHVKGQAFSNELLLVQTEGGKDALKVKVNEEGTSVTYAEEIVVQIPKFPDYVFEKDYKRMSLEETEKYINRNGRLPKMPSAETVADEGAKVGEIVNLLVEKVEELTLELIELNKKNQALEEKLNKLNK
jgi:hypothetical protein